jgi:predicted esterase
MAASGATRVGAAICALGALVAATTTTTWLRSRKATPATLDAIAPSYADERDMRPSTPPPGPAEPSRSGEPSSLITPSGRTVELYPPFDPHLRERGGPIVLMLHGMGGDPRNTCDFWSDDARATGWLACPSGNAGCCGRFDWKGSGDEKARYLDEAVGVVRAAVPKRGEEQPPILIGFSRGAFVARDVIYARPGVFDAVILLGAAVNPDPDRFKASGIRRVVLASGDYDGARASMIQSAKRLEAAGLPARFVALGRIGHALPTDLGRILRDALQWERDRDGS